MSNLRVLSLRGNNITSLQGLFQNCTNLTHLYLQDNKIEQIPDGVFNSLQSLRVLYLNNNKIKRISQDSFLGLVSLQTLYLRSNKISAITDDSFRSMAHLRHLTLDHFTLCCYASIALPNVDCKAPNDEFSSCDDLMKDKTLQVCIWVLGISAFFGNIFVVAYRLVVREDNRVQSLLLTNLAISDFMMGLYLLIIAFKDVQWQGEYFKYDLSWRVSGLCQFAGALSMISSEVSVLMLTIITLDRFICIVFPMRFGRLGLKKAFALCILVWTFGMLISIVPILGIEYFYDEQLEIGFYGRSSVCLPLQLSSDRPAGWEYSVSFFIGLNFMAFMFILVAYIAIFWTVRKSSAAVGSRNAKKEAALARKLMAIIMTDFCCWMPVIFIGILSLTGDFRDPQKLAYVWIAVFVLPVNSSINPILYTFSGHVKKLAMQYSRSMWEFLQNKVSSTASVQASPGHSRCRDDKKHVIAQKVSSEGSLTLKITGRAEILPESGNGVGYIKGFVSGATTEQLLKVFPEKNAKEFKHEVAVLKKIISAQDHDNLLKYRWHQKGKSLVFDMGDAQGINLNSNYRVICFDYPPSMSTLSAFLCEADFTVSLETLLAIIIDAMQGVEHLHKHGVAHGNINQDTVLVCQARRTPSIKVCIGGYETARIIARRDTEAYRIDVHQLGKLQQLTLRSCGYDKDISAQIREVIDMCYWDATNWKLRVSEIRQQLEQAWISTNDRETRV
ncbi:G-protein coupled receptor GRL101 [Nematostella vectensis]|nr:G-protein coupled receptor GRL101 [Nematostella vectensis]